MDGIVTVADTAAGPDTLNHQFEAVSQIAMADLIVITERLPAVAGRFPF